MSAINRVLHVDDEPVIGDLIRLSLEKGGRFQVDIANSAHEALDLLKSGSYSCIISDYEMPQMNGIDFLKEVRTIDTDIPFILFSGRGRETVIIDAINTGADFYIQKGGDAKALFAELNHKVEYAIGQRNTRLALKRRDGILEAVSLVANLFLSGDSFNSALEEAITLFGLATEVDVVRLFRLDTETNNSSLHNLASWTRIQVQTDENEHFIRTGAIPVSQSFLRQLSRGAPVMPDAEGIKRLDPCKSDNLPKAVAIFPVYVEQSMWGMIWFADYLSERVWSGVEVDALLAAAAMIGSAIQQDTMRTSLIQAKEKYESMNNLIRRLCDTVPDLLWARDGLGRFLFINKAGSNFMNAPDTTMPIGRTEYDFPTRKISLDQQIGDLFFEADTPTTRQYTTIEEGPKEKALEITTVPFKNPDGVLIGSVTYGHDITQYCEIEAKLRRERQRYARIIESIHIGVILTDQNGTILALNPRAGELIQESETDCVGMNISKIETLREMEIPDILRDAILSDQILSCSGPTKLTGGSVDLYCMVKPLHISNGDQREILITLDVHYYD